jgi:hypothetical protein
MDKLSTLWKGASYQDNLLQSYRGLHLTVQSILIAVGAGLSIATMTFDGLIKILFTYFLLLAISIFGVYLLKTMQKLIQARGEDVDYFHIQIIEHEKTLTKSEQVLTAFKVYQKFDRNKTNINEYFENFELTDSIRNQLTSKGKGHTRQLLDKYLFSGFMIIWVCFHLISIWTVFMTF